eukprot:Hpha_TRINITY_DN20940_c0_g1::TRINITY_DN20940_c0_g1_i1::g.139755::m.139755
MARLCSVPAAASLLGLALAGAPDPPNLGALECALHQEAFEFGSRLTTSNLGSLSAALNLESCARRGLLSPSQVAANRRALEASPARPSHHFTRPIGSGPTFFVATDGSDSSGDGSSASPFATLEHARDAARQAANGATIFVRGGKYFLNRTLELTPQDSGLTIAAYGGEQVILSGARRLGALDWAPAGGGMAAGVFKAKVQLPTRASRATSAASTTATEGCGLEYGTDFKGNDITKVTTAANVTDCCAKCKAFPGCTAFTIEHQSGGRCWLKNSDAGRRSYADHVSGRPGNPPPPTPAPVPVHPAALVNSLFINGTRAIRARFPNGNPQDNSGLCFSKIQHPGVEGCPGYLSAAGSHGTQDGGEKVTEVDFALNRGESPTLGCKQCTTYGSFKYTIYDPPAGHPVYSKPLPSWGWPNNSVPTFWGSLFSRPAGLLYDPKTWTQRNWTHPEDG